MEKQLASLLALLPQAEVIGSADKVITDVTADSRAVVAGSLFVCLKGATFDDGCREGRCCCAGGGRSH